MRCWSWSDYSGLSSTIYSPLLKRSYFGGGPPAACFDLVELKDKQGNDVLQVTGQTGPHLEIDTPNMTTNKWNFGAGGSFFLGVTLSYTTHTPLF
jgi:hypothetical protein